MEKVRVVLQLLLLAALGMLIPAARKFVTAYGTRKGENFATKEDIAGITHEAEQARAVYTEKLEQIAHQNRILLEQLKPLTAEETLRRENFVNSKLKAYHDAIEALTKALASMEWRGGPVPTGRLAEPSPTESTLNAAAAKLALFTENPEVLEFFYRTGAGGDTAIHDYQRFIALARADMKYESVALQPGQFKYVFGRSGPPLQHEAPLPDA